MSDADFTRYGVTADDLKRVMNGHAKVKTSLVAIGEGANSAWLLDALPGRAHLVRRTEDIATVLRTILGSMLGGGGGL